MSTTTAIPAAGPHGGDGARVAAALGLGIGDILDLSASLNPVAPDISVVVARHMDALGRYPDANGATVALAAALGVAEDGVLLTNGGAEAISLVAAELGGAADEPDFALYPRDRSGRGPRWRSNPHNPTGILAMPDECAGVWDEAFYPLATGDWTRGDADRGAVVVGSLTKVFACPGLRAGYVIGRPAVVERLRARQPQWSVNGLVAAALPELVEAADLRRWSTDIAELRAQLATLLGSHGLDPQPSDAPFVLCANGLGLRERLAPHGVVVRDCASFGLVGQARVAVPSAAGLDRLEAALTRSET